MNRDLRIILLKQLVNVPLGVVDKLLPFPENPEFPQTRMLLQIYAKMMKAYGLDCMQGTFGARPDGNFERFLRVAVKILSRISEDDRYYRAWVGLAVLLAEVEYAAFDRDPQKLKRLIKMQWLLDLDSIPDEHVTEFVDDFVEMALCDYLGNLARMEVGSPASLDQKMIGGIN